MTPTKEWECPKCSKKITTALPCFEVSHPCPKDLGKPVYLKPLKGTQ